MRVHEHVIPDSVTPVAAMGDGASATGVAPPCDTTGPQRGLTIAVNWSDDTTTSPSVATIDSRYYGATNSLADYWDEASYGKVQLTGDTLGWFTLNMTRAEGCNSGMVRAQALEIAAQHTDLTQYNRIFIVMRNPSPGCGWAGLGTLSCSTFSTTDGQVTASTHWVLSSYFNNANSAVWLAAHEAGHNITLHHAGVRDYGANSIGPIGDTSGGSLVEYGDRYDSMGNHGSRPSHYNAVHKHRIGWLTEFDITHVNGSGSVLLDPMSTPLGGIKAARVFRGVATANYAKEYLWLESRQPVGYDAFMDTRGHGTIIVHHQTAYASTKTENLDLTPGSAAGTNDYFDAPLASGQSFTDPHTGITITHGGVDGQGRVLALVTQDPAYVDSDEDGVSDVREGAYGTNPNLADTDGDGVDDLHEICHDGNCDNYSPFPDGGDMNALSQDTDGDGLDDGVEFNQYHTNPASTDTDGDGLGDYDEINTHGTSPTASDTDQDGLSDYEEIVTYQTNPLERDTDGDGLLDGYEISSGSDPNVPNGIESWDGTITGRVTTADGRGVAGLTLWDVSKYPQTVTTDEDGYFAIRGYTGGEWVWINSNAATAAGYTLTAQGWSGGQFQHDGGAIVARNYLATPKTDTVRGKVRLPNGEPLAGLTFWDVTKYPATVTTRADGTFLSQSYASGSWILFNTYNTGSQGYTLSADGWSGGQFQHDGTAMSGYDYVATQTAGTISGRITTPDGKPVAGITFWDVSKYPTTLTTGADGRFTGLSYSAGDWVWFNTYNAGQAGYTLVPSGWSGGQFQHDGSAMQNFDYIAVPVTVQ